jgi:hypothetical protein
LQGKGEEMERVERYYNDEDVKSTLCPLYRVRLWGRPLKIRRNWRRAGDLFIISIARLLKELI